MINDIQSALDAGGVFLLPEKDRLRKPGDDYNQWVKKSLIRLNITENIPGHIEMSIVVDKNTTIDAIRNAWYLICEWRERLPKHRFLPGESEKQFYDRLCGLHEQGASYKEIAWVINEKIGDLLEGYIKYRREFDDSLLFLPRMHDLMRWMGLDEEERAEWVQDFLNGELFPPNAPVTGDMVRERVRRWRDKQRELGRVVDIG